MIKKKQKVRFGGANPIAGIAYTCAVSFALMYTICLQELLICSVIMCAAASGIFMLLFMLHKKPIGAAVMTGLLTTACFGVIFIISSLFMDFVRGANQGELGEESFIYFLFTASAKFSAANAAKAIALFSVVIGFTCCYFSVTMPRIGFLLLPSLIPLILSTRTSAGLPMWMIVLLFTGYILAACCTARPLPDNSAVFTESSAHRQRAITSACLAAAVTIVAALAPKSEETIFRHYLDAMTLNSPGFYSGNALLGNFSVRSSVNTGNNTPSDEVLFTVQTNAAQNLDRCSFDICNGDDGWGYLSEYETGFPNWELYAQERRPAVLFNALKKGAEAGKLQEYADVLLALPDVRPVTGQMFISTAAASNTAVVMHPQSTYSVNITDYNGDIYRTFRGEMFAAYDISEGEYLLKYHAELPSPAYAKAAAQLDFTQLLRDAAEEGVISNVTANAFIDEYRYASEYRASTAMYEVDSKITELAHDITRGYATDYEKALAIERWFGEQEFVYDLDFKPESAEAAYFLFESKRGICSDFATALTLLAREAGLTARYVEGFALAPESLDENGIYNVTAASAHAYTQIYIAGCGWLSFDGTSYALTEERNDISDKVFYIIILSLAAAAIIAAVIILLRRPLSWLGFNISYPLRSKKSRIKGVYLRARRLACSISHDDEACTTTGDTRRILTNVLSMPQEADIICSAADSLFYSDSIPETDTAVLLRALKRLRRRKRGRK